MGRDYLAAMVREYDGDVSKALAAVQLGTATWTGR